MRPLKAIQPDHASIKHKSSAMFLHTFFLCLSCRKKRFAWNVASVLFVVLFCSGYAAASQAGMLYAFGDSGIDTGNAYYFSERATPDAALGYWQGRFCDGPNYLDQLADAYTQWGSAAYMLGGTNAAFGGGESGSGNSEKYGVPNLQEQIVLFSAENPGFTFSAQDVVLISTGHNDLLSHLASPPDTSTIAQYVIESVVALQAMGAKHFIIPTTIPVHLSPGVRDSGDITPAQAREWLVSFNSKLDAELAVLQSACPELTIVRTDLFSKLEYVYDHPPEYGLTNVTDASYNGHGTPASYFWFDTMHVTSHISGYIAQWILAEFRLQNVSVMTRVQFFLLCGVLLGIGLAWNSRKGKGPIGEC